MIRSSLLKTRLRLLQCYDIELTALICHTKRLPSKLLLSLGTGVQPSTVNCVFRLMQWYDRELTAFGMSLRTALSEPLFSVGPGVQPLFVNRQPCLWVSLDCSQQLIQNFVWADRFLTIPWFNTRSLMHSVFSSDLNVLTASAVILVLLIGTIVRSCKSIYLAQSYTRLDQVLLLGT